MFDRKRVVIIGSGLGGLSCGTILQKNGFDVTVVEQGTQPGGCLQCFERKGAKFETGMHFIGSALPGQTMHSLMNYLGLLDDVKLSQLDENGYDIVSLAGQNFSFANGREPFIETMASYFPKEKDNIRKYYDIVKLIASSSALHSLTSSHRDDAIHAEYQLKSINDELDQIFSDEMLKNVIVGALPLYSAQLDKTPFAQHAHIADFYNQSAFRIVGGSDHIARSLVANIGRMGGQVITRCKVHRIVCDERQAVGVDTDKGFINADIVVSTIHPMRTLELLAGTNILRPAFCKRINSMPQTNGGFSVYLKFKKNTVPYMNSNFYAYRGNTPWNCEQYTDEQWPKGFLYMHMCHKENPVWAESGIIISYMNYDEVAKWHGTKIGRRGDDYERFKKERAERLINDIERHFPGFKDSIDSFYTSTPLTYVDYTGTEQGSMYGIAKDISLGVAGRVPYRTRIPNLLLAGQNVNSHGMLGVLVGTIIACSELIPAQTIYGQIQQSKCR